MRHEDQVWEASFSKDGRRIVTPSGTTARIWDAETGNPLGEPLRHKGPVRTAKFSADGSRIVTASWDYTARVWDAETGKPLGEPFLHEGLLVATASFSADGRRIITTSHHQPARVWDTETGKPLGEPLGNENVVQANFSADGRRIVTASDDTAQVWDAETGKPLGELLRHDGLVTVASFSSDGSRLVTASYDKTARVWDAAVDLASPLPPWVPELAEALAEHWLNEDGQLVQTNKSILELRKALLGLKGDDFWSRFGRWFFLRGPERTISPDSRITIGELERLRAEAEKAPTPPTQP